MNSEIDGNIESNVHFVFVPMCTHHLFGFLFPDKDIFVVNEVHIRRMPDNITWKYLDNTLQDSWRVGGRVKMLALRHFFSLSSIALIFVSRTT